MKKQQALVLYFTDHCHLCELAKAVCQQVLVAGEYSISEQDIAESDDLINRYGTRIPVLQNSQTGKELNWPFTAEDLIRFLSEPAQAD